MSGWREEILSDGVRLINADCRDVLPTLGKVDAVVTDPPYGIGESSKKNATRGKASAIWGKASKGTAVAYARDYGEHDWDHEPASPETIRAIRDCSKWQIIFGGNYFEGLPPSSCWLVWDKENGTNAFADCELAWTNLDKPVRRIDWMWNGMLRRGGELREGHPTQKPLEVMCWCIGHLPSDAATIVDPYMGSGTTGMAAISLGRKFIGIEIEERYFSIACRRISDELKRPRLPFEEAKPAVQESLSL